MSTARSACDLVNHCVNDILVQGARPLFFLDYLATGRLQPDVAEQIVEGLARACRENGCALLGGETAEMPGFYADGEYDLAGFIVGVVEGEHADRRAEHRDRRRADRAAVERACTRTAIRLRGGLPSIISVSSVDDAGRRARARRWARRCCRRTAPICTRSTRWWRAGAIKGMAHITGGGITDNLPRMLPRGDGRPHRSRGWNVPPLFQWLQRAGDVPDDDMLRTFNMGIGLILVCTPALVGTVMDDLRARHEEPVVIGEIVRGSRDVVYA